MRSTPSSWAWDDNGALTIPWLPGAQMGNFLTVVATFSLFMQLPAAQDSLSLSTAPTW